MEGTSFSLFFRYGYAEALHPSQGRPNARICTQKHGAGWLSLVGVLVWFASNACQGCACSWSVQCPHSFLLIIIIIIIIIYVLIIIGAHHLC